MECSRARKSGIGADIEKKREEEWDKAHEEGVMDSVVLWINAVTQGEHDSIPNSSLKELHRSLKDGIQLCKLVNKLLLSDGLQKVTFQKKAISPFVAMGNLESFNTGCKRYGLSDGFCFQTSDLYEGRKGPFLNVINCIHSLGFLAIEKGFEPTYTGRQTKYLDNE